MLESLNVKFLSKLVSFVIGLIFFSSCTVNIPDIKVTGEKTALENQVLGEYKKIKEDAWMVASERGNTDIGNKNKLEIPTDKKEIVEAIRNREFNKDDVDEFKTLGLIGENREGLIQLVVEENELKKNLKPKDIKLVSKIISEENIDREIIIMRIYDLSFKNEKDNNSKDKIVSEIKLSFFKMNLNESPEDTFYLNEQNKWERK